MIGKTTRIYNFTLNFLCKPICLISDLKKLNNNGEGLFSSNIVIAAPPGVRGCW